jgi:uracil-DNA glycosylase
MSELRIDPQIEESWKQVLFSEFQKPYFYGLKSFLLEERRQGVRVYPPGLAIFRAFDLCPLDEVKVVILGQDPYHGDHQAHGLSFSVLPPTKPPPSLVNIFKELEADLNFKPPAHGDLSAWAKQGVLLLNTVLTVKAHAPASHRKKGWELFTDEVIRIVSHRCTSVAFVFWGKDAQSKEPLVEGNHLIIKSSHPSPYSARYSFLGSRPFSRINSYRKDLGLSSIDWSL